MIRMTEWFYKPRYYLWWVLWNWKYLFSKKNRNNISLGQNTIFNPHLSMQNQRNQNIFLIRFQHYVWHRNGRRRHGHLKEVQCPFIVFIRRIDHTTIVIIEQQIFCVVIAFLCKQIQFKLFPYRTFVAPPPPSPRLTYIGDCNCRYVHVQELKSRLKYFCAQTQFIQIGVYGCQLRIEQTNLFDGLWQYLNAMPWNFMFHQVAGKQVAQLSVYRRIEIWNNSVNTGNGRHLLLTCVQSEPHLFAVAGIYKVSNESCYLLGIGKRPLCERNQISCHYQAENQKVVNLP